MLLNWVSPSMSVASIRVVRSHLGFPVSPSDGAIVYQGRGESFTMRVSLKNIRRFIIPCLFMTLKGIFLLEQ